MANTLIHFDQNQSMKTNTIMKSHFFFKPNLQAMVFPVVMYGCEVWTVKKAEHQRIDAFECGVGEDS